MTAETRDREDRTGGGRKPDTGALLDALDQDGGAALLRALGNDRSAAAVVRSLLARVDLPPEQEAVIGLLLAAQQNGDDAVGDDGDGDGDGDGAPAPRGEPSRAPRGARAGRGLRRLRRELEGLREVNDTLAAALGACPGCWGGDEDCEACGGRGSAGSMPPDAELFEELVLPAVRRVRADLRHRRSGIGRRRY